MIPLLLEVESALDGVDRRVLFTFAEAAAACFARVHQFRGAGLPVHVLRGRNIDLLSRLRIVGKAVGLRVHAQPVPRIRRIRIRWRTRPEGGAEGEKLTNRGPGVIWVAQQEGLAVPMEPKIVEFSGPIEFFQQLIRHVGHVRVEHENDLRSATAFLADLQDHGKELVEHFLVNGAVGRIQNECVDARIGKHVHVPANDPRILLVVVTEERLAPMSHVP